MFAVWSRQWRGGTWAYKIIPSPVRPNRMLQKLFSIRVVQKEDMARLEEVVVGLLGGEHHRCSFLRSDEFVKLRNYALYCKQKTSTRSVHVEGLKIVLLSTGKACVYLTDPCVVPLADGSSSHSLDQNDDEASFIGKRRRVVSPKAGESEDDEGGGYHEEDLPPPGAAAAEDDCDDSSDGEA